MLIVFKGRGRERGKGKKKEAKKSKPKVVVSGGSGRKSMACFCGGRLFSRCNVLPLSCAFMPSSTIMSLSQLHDVSFRGFIVFYIIIIIGILSFFFSSCLFLL